MSPSTRRSPAEAGPRAIELAGEITPECSNRVRHDLGGVRLADVVTDRDALIREVIFWAAVLAHPLPIRRAHIVAAAKAVGDPTLADGVVTR